MKENITVSVDEVKNFDVTVIVPSLNPDDKLKGVVEDLLEAGFDDIVVINDGSASEYVENFPAPSANVTLLVHEVNRGKGAAMKTAFRHVLEREKKPRGVITVDGDGQHRTCDVVACVKEMLSGEPALILGCRDFDLPQVPGRSRFGNKFTSGVFKIFFGMTISDTQTGLRAIPVEYLPLMLEVSGDRYEYETNMLMALKPEKIPLREVKIETVYIDENATSHFRVVRDSIRIYGLIIKFILASVSSFVVDTVGYYGFLRLFRGLVDRTASDYLAGGVSRLVSSVFNFIVNKETVFKGRGNPLKFLLKYYALAIPIAAVSTVTVHFLGLAFGASPLLQTLFKIPVDLLLFIISFRVQREWVFRDSDDKKNDSEKK